MLTKYSTSCRIAMTERHRRDGKGCRDDQGYLSDGCHKPLAILDGAFEQEVSRRRWKRTVHLIILSLQFKLLFLLYFSIFSKFTSPIIIPNLTYQITYHKDQTISHALVSLSRLLSMPATFILARLAQLCFSGMLYSVSNGGAALLLVRWYYSME